MLFEVWTRKNICFLNFKSEVYKFCLYFIRYYKNCEKYGLDPHKEILLSGPVGCGKTSWMKLLKYLSPNVINYEVIPSRFLTFQFNSKGFEVIEKYGSGFSFCFDDLGVEPDGKHIGQDCNVMGKYYSQGTIYSSKTKN